MKVFKFGGASVKNTEAVKNVARIISEHGGDSLVVIVSAINKTTNRLEQVVEAIYDSKPSERNLYLEQAINEHKIILDELNISAEKQEEILDHFKTIKEIDLGDYSFNYDQLYDEIVSRGELVSTSIVNTYLNETGVQSLWLDAKSLVKTDNTFRDAKLDWSLTEKVINGTISSRDKIYITQGFIGGDVNNQTTTLGREGSDYSAGIFAYVLGAESVTIWKDVPGMLNADPKWFENTMQLNKISFKEAIELSYYGATIIHPKTLKPLKNKQIPLYVKSFLDPSLNGTVIQENEAWDKLVPSFIFKMNQVLISLTPRDFSLIMEDSLREIFEILSEYNVKVNLIQNSALNCSICVDNDKRKLETVLKVFKESFTVKLNTNLELLTIRHYNDKLIEDLITNKEILVEQKSRDTARFVMRDLLA